eukprot:scaffold789_cov261-Pinguiococcus_pyrenoidosus.AAC.9
MPISPSGFDRGRGSRLRQTVRSLVDWRRRLHDAQRIAAVLRHHEWRDQGASVARESELQQTPLPSLRRGQARTGGGVHPRSADRRSRPTPHSCGGACPPLADGAGEGLRARSGGSATTPSTNRSLTPHLLQGVSRPEVIAPLPEDSQSIADDESSVCSSVMDGPRRRSLLTRCDHRIRPSASDATFD